MIICAFSNALLVHSFCALMLKYLFIPIYQFKKSGKNSNFSKIKKVMSGEPPVTFLSSVDHLKKKGCWARVSWSSLMQQRILRPSSHHPSMSQIWTCPELMIGFKRHECFSYFQHCIEQIFYNRIYQISWISSGNVCNLKKSQLSSNKFMWSAYVLLIYWKLITCHQ